MDAVLWGLSRLFPAAPPTPWLDVPTGDGAIGPDWPARWTGGLGASFQREPDGGLLPDMSVIRGAEALHPLVRAFYEHTGRFSLAVQPGWGPGMRLGGWLWAVLFARRWGQLELPTVAEPLSNEIYASGAPDVCRWWVRQYADRRVLYVSRYELVSVVGEPDVCARITFPVPGGAWVVLFRIVVDGDALVLTEDGGRPGGPGCYLLRTGRPARYVRANREEIRVSPTDDGCRAVHRLWFLGIPFLTLSYELPLSEARGDA
jgi:hypothetical protein